MQYVSSRSVLSKINVQEVFLRTPSDNRRKTHSSTKIGLIGRRPLGKLLLACLLPYSLQQDVDYRSAKLSSLVSVGVSCLTVVSRVFWAGKKAARKFDLAAKHSICAERGALTPSQASPHIYQPSHYGVGPSSRQAG